MHQEANDNQKYTETTSMQGEIEKSIFFFTPRQNAAKRLFKRKQWYVEHPVVTQALKLWKPR